MKNDEIAFSPKAIKDLTERHGEELAIIGRYDLKKIVERFPEIKEALAGVKLTPISFD